MTSGKWASSTRRARLPKNWESEIRPHVLERDNYRCTDMTPAGRCQEVANNVDHVIPGDDHRYSNLTSLCGPHHAAKSAREGVEARAAKKAATLRPPELHPGRRV